MTGEAIPFETPDLYGAFPRLTEEQIGSLAEHGRRFPVEPGEVLIREGERAAEFLVVLSGSVAVVEDFGGPGERVLRVHGQGRFLGEVGLLSGQVAFTTTRAGEAGEILSVPVDRMRVLVARDPGLGDLVLRAHLGRRALLVGAGAGFRVIGSRYSPDTGRLREFAARNRLPHRWTDLEADQEAEAALRRFSVRPEETPIVIWRAREVLRNPSNAELARLIGLTAPPAAEEGRCDVLVIGSGPAGLAAAVYGASEGLSTVVMDAIATGGQAGTSSRIENYFGFPAGISGAELAELGVFQAHKFGAAVRVPAEATALAPDDGRYRVALADGGEVISRSVVLATGARYHRLDVPGIERLESTGVHYAATVYEAQQCRADPVAVVGGGNSSGQAALFLADHVPRAYLLVRGADLTAKMSRYLIDRIERHPRVKVLCNTEAREVIGEDALRGVVVENNLSGERRKLDVRALFCFIGAVPRTAWLAGSLALDDRGFVVTGAPARARAGPAVWEGHDRGSMPLETSLPGVFAAGDVRSGSVKRVASAVGEGAMAIHHAHEHLSHLATYAPPGPPLEPDGGHNTSADHREDGGDGR
ncbi:FAD-dependent oxidoreductase [Streptomyces sp. NPDC059679]|uniref:FAD-dependent oxidoreductase n=1 Tax=Streptomyces sp. NPDC059679 TaxID=3346903 RepID=UPI0036B6C322